MTDAYCFRSRSALVWQSCLPMLPLVENDLLVMALGRRPSLGLSTSALLFYPVRNCSFTCPLNLLVLRPG
jgi:hypothetical protein